jgi:hypothetical protein
MGVSDGHVTPVRWSPHLCHQRRERHPILMTIEHDKALTVLQNDVALHGGVAHVFSWNQKPASEGRVGGAA